MTKHEASAKRVIELLERMLARVNAGDLPPEMAISARGISQSIDRMDVQGWRVADCMRLQELQAQIDAGLDAMAS